MLAAATPSTARCAAQDAKRCSSSSGGGGIAFRCRPLGVGACDHAAMHAMQCCIPKHNLAAQGMQGLTNRAHLSHLQVSAACCPWPDRRGSTHVHRSLNARAGWSPFGPGASGPGSTPFSEPGLEYEESEGGLHLVSTRSSAGISMGGLVPSELAALAGQAAEEAAAGAALARSRKSSAIAGEPPILPPLSANHFRQLQQRERKCRSAYNCLTTLLAARGIHTFSPPNPEKHTHTHTHTHTAPAASEPEIKLVTKLRPQQPKEGFWGDFVFKARLAW
jgi:hypothetical protein